MDPIRFVAAVQKVQTLVDGGIRVTLDLPEDAILAAADLMACKRHGMPVSVICTPGETDGSGSGRKGKSMRF